MSHCGLGGWIDQFKNCFAHMEMQSDRNATEDPTKSCRVTKHRGLIEKSREFGVVKGGLTWLLETYSNQENNSATTDVLTKGNAWQGCSSIGEIRESTCENQSIPSMKSHIFLSDEHVSNTFEKYSWQVNRKQHALI